MEYHINYVLEGCKNGDKDCQMELIKEVTPNIYKVLNSYRLSDDLREELLQEGYIIVLQTARTYDGNSGVPYFGYLKRALYYGLYDKLYKPDEVHFEDETIEGKKIIDSLKDPEEPFDEVIAEGETHEILHRAVQSLEEEERQVIINKFFRDRTYKEIAKGFGMKYPQVLYIAHKALKNLKNSMKNI